jgi:XTP/dITP diphosphohydrolase
MRELLIATTNEGKLKEIAHIFKHLPFKCVSLADIKAEGDVEEVGETFEGNAILKALIWGKRSGMLSLTDDSGLEVDALGGRPGVYSARYPGKDWPDRRKNLLKEMSDVPENKRTARFRSVIAIYDPKDDKTRVCSGDTEGTITHEDIGTNGFGYDPIFRFTDTGKTGGEMELEEKNKISHRGRAIVKAITILKKEFV